MPGKKRRQRIIQCAAGALWVACAGLQATAEGVSLGEAAYDREVLPVLKQFCADCHRRVTSKGRWAFDAYQRYADALTDREACRKVRQLVQYHIMPPHGEQAPTPGQRRAIVDSIEGSVFHVDPARPDRANWAAAGEQHPAGTWQPVVRVAKKTTFQSLTPSVLVKNDDSAHRHPARKGDSPSST